MLSRSVRRGVVLAVAVAVALTFLATPRSSGERGEVPLALATTVNPASATIGPGWDGIDYLGAGSCPSCAVADVGVANGNGYVVEVSNSQIRVWTSSGAELLNRTLNSFAAVAGSNRLVQPQVVYDNATQRWFVSFLDTSTGAIYYGGSLSSDPTATGTAYWNFQQFAAPHGTTFDQPRLALDTSSVVLVSNLWSNPTTILGFEAFAANKAQLIAGTPPQTCTSGRMGNATDASYVPASDLSSSNTTYLVSVDAGGTTSFLLRTLTGTPTTCTVSAPTVLVTRTTTSPNASQPGTRDLLETSGNLTSASWRAGSLWAAATDGCVPSGDSAMRSCLHLWKVSTAADSMAQDFTWSRGAGYYEFDPAVTTDTAGDLVVVYGESSAANSENASLYVAIQSPSDVPGTLESPQVLEAGTGPDAPASGCSHPGLVCPFGLWFGASVDPLSSSTFWVVGEYMSATSGTDYWRSWVNEVAATGGITWIAGSVTPANSTLRIDHVAIALAAGAFNVTVAAGTHLLEAQFSGYVSFSTEVTVGAGLGIRLTITLDPVAPPPGTPGGLLLPIPLWAVLVLAAALVVGLFLVTRLLRRRATAPRPWPKPQGGSGTAEIGSAIAAALDRRAASEREERERRKGGDLP